MKPGKVALVRKSTKFNILDIDTAKGLVDSVVNIFGIIDLGNDIVHNGAFKQTIQERAGRIRVLDSHNTHSARSVIGKPLEIRELKQAELPDTIRREFPDATGGLFTRSQFNLSSSLARDIFALVENADVNEWSIGFDIIESDFESLVRDEEEIVVRNIRAIRLWEYSAVVFGMNQATDTTDVKSEYVIDSYTVREFPDVFVWELPDWRPLEKDYTLEQRVVRGHDGVAASICNPSDATCHKLNGYEFNTKLFDIAKSHAWIQEYDNEDLKLLQDVNDVESITLRSPDVETDKEMTPEGPVQRMGDVLTGFMHQIFTVMADDWLIEGMLSQEERIEMSSAVGDALRVLNDGMPEQVRLRRLPDKGFLIFSSRPSQTADQPRKVGSDEPPATRSGMDVTALKRRLELRQRRIRALM